MLLLHLSHKAAAELGCKGRPVTGDTLRRLGEGLKAWLGRAVQFTDASTGGQVEEQPAALRRVLRPPGGHR